MYTVNRKNIAVANLVARNGEKRLQYVHVSPKGTTVVSPELIGRVSLPRDEYVKVPFVYPIDRVDEAASLKGEKFHLEGEMPAVTGPKLLVPQMDKCFPEAHETTATFTCDASLLKKLLDVACQVCDDPSKTIRLRIIENGRALRLDTYAEPDQQAFCGVLKPINYEGVFIAGELPSGAPKPEKKPQQTGLLLKTAEGRRFRGAGE